MGLRRKWLALMALAIGVDRRGVIGYSERRVGMEACFGVERFERAEDRVHGPSASVKDHQIAERYSVSIPRPAVDHRGCWYLR
jgi:hypothetical protein